MTGATPLRQTSGRLGSQAMHVIATSVATSLRLQAECGYNPVDAEFGLRLGADEGNGMNMQSQGQKKASKHNRAAKVSPGVDRLRVISLLMMLVAGTVGLSALSTGWASEYKKAATQNYLVEPNPDVSLETATAIIRHRTGGRVLSANSASRGSEVGYQVRVLVDERQVQTWFVDHKGRAQNE